MAVKVKLLNEELMFPGDLEVVMNSLGFIEIWDKEEDNCLFIVAETEVIYIKEE